MTLTLKEALREARLMKERNVAVISVLKSEFPIKTKQLLRENLALDKLLDFVNAEVRREAGRDPEIQGLPWGL